MPVSTTPSPVFRGHLPALDGLRGIAILLVIFVHFAVFVPVGRLEHWFKHVSLLGLHGVDLFFVLSGFLITGILLDSKGMPHFLRNFYVRRSLRIFPLYYAVLCICFVAIPSIVASGQWVWYMLYASNLLFVTKHFILVSELGITWSLAIEEQFYLAWAVAVIFLRPETLLRICAFVVCGAFLLRVGMWLTGFSMNQIFGFTLCRADTLAWGAGLAVYVRSPRYRPKKIYRVAIVTALATAAVFVTLFFFRFFLELESPVWYTVGFSLVAAFFAQVLVLALHATWASRALVWWPLRFFGKYSYGIYLLHLPVRDFLLRGVFSGGQLERWFSFPMGKYLVFYAVATLAVIPPALVSWHLFEKQFLKLKSFFPSGARGRTANKFAELHGKAQGA